MQDRSLLLTAAVVALLVVAAVVVVAVRPGSADLDPSSPEGVVQAYVAAVLDGDEDEARSLLAELPDPCFAGGDRTESIRVTLSGVDVDGDEAEVRLVVTVSGGEPPFGRYEYGEEEVFSLERAGGGWLIDRVPWRFQVCPEEDT